MPKHKKAKKIVKPNPFTIIGTTGTHTTTSWAQDWGKITINSDYVIPKEQYKQYSRKVYSNHSDHMYVPVETTNSLGVYQKYGNYTYTIPAEQIEKILNAPWEEE